MLSNEKKGLLKKYSSVLKEDNGVYYRDLNKNGKMDVYENPSESIDNRVEDLLSQMTLEEKAGTLFINGSAVSPDGSIDEGVFDDKSKQTLLAKEQILQNKMNNFNLWDVPSALATAIWYNNIQSFAEQTRLGIPISIASDPRNHFSNYIYDVLPKEFSQWCSQLGLASIGDEEFVQYYANMIRQEYLAVGIRIALHPQIDLATEPRWPRISGTFGEDAELSAKLVTPYILGFQGEELGDTSVACMTKHFPGGGPQKEGLDPHFEFHKGQIYPGNNFKYHLIPFKAAIAANTAAIMPYYGVPMGQTDENVGMSYNKQIVTNLLREEFGFNGLVCTDWGLVTDQISPDGYVSLAKAWGVEHLSRKERVKKILETGVDQFGGESCSELVVELVNSGEITEERINESVRRVLRLKFQLGLFDNPFIDLDHTKEVFTGRKWKDAGHISQTKAMVLLKNENQCLPLSKEYKVFIRNINPEALSKYAKLSNDIEDADFAIIRLKTPWYPVETEDPVGKDFHHGDLDFKGEEKESIMQLLQSKPTIVVIGMDRPAVIPEISQLSKGLIVEFGASDEAVLDVIFGVYPPQGKLPFELPSSMEAVRNQFPDVPYDSENPLYKFGYGLSYK